MISRFLHSFGTAIVAHSYPSPANINLLVSLGNLNWKYPFKSDCPIWIVSLSNIVIAMALSKNWLIVFPLKVLCPNAEKMHKNNDMENVVLNLNVFGFHIVAKARV